MQTTEISSSESTAHTLGHGAPVIAPVTAGWFVRRMVLWVLFVGLGVAGACLLYMVASQAEAESAARTASVGEIAQAGKH